MTRPPVSLDRLLTFLHLGAGLAVLGLWLALVLIGIAALAGLWRTPMIWGLVLTLLWLGTSLSGVRHLSAALGAARGGGVFHGEVSERLRPAGRRLVYAAALSVLALPALLLGARAVSEGELGTQPLELLHPNAVVGSLLSLAVPLLLMALARWLDEGRELQSRAREVV